MAFMTEEEATRLMGTVRLGVFVFVDIAPEPLRLWFGVGDFELDADAIDTVGGVYSGLGELNDLPALSQLINGVFERIELSMSGVSAQALALADEDAESVVGAGTHFAILGLDGDWQPTSAAKWLWEGGADTPRFSWDTSASPEGEVTHTRTIALSVGTAMTGRKRPPWRNFTGVEQRRISADDAFCDRVGLYSRGSTRKWP